MLRNIVWLALVNLQRKARASVILFLAACICSGAFLLAGIVRNLIALPDIGAAKIILQAIVVSALILNASVLAVLSFSQLEMRKSEYAILRIGGVQKADIILLQSLETIFITSAGALSGVIIIIALILSKAIYLPYFFKGLPTASVLRLIGTAGQAVFTVIIIELAVSVPFVASILKEDVYRLEREIVRRQRRAKAKVKGRNKHARNQGQS